MKIQRLYATIAPVAFVVLAACGGGGGSSSPNSTSESGLECPTGEQTTPATESACATVHPLHTTVSQGDVVSPVTMGAIVTTMSGTINPASVTATTVKMTCGTDPVPGTASLSSDGKAISFLPAVRLGFGLSSCILLTTVKDTLDRTIDMSVTFSTVNMTCVDSNVYSNPATFSANFKDCVADVGIQTLVRPGVNTLQDNSCVVTIGVPLTSSCKAYLANGTMMLSNTSIVVNGHAVIWMSFIGTDGVSTLVLLDVNDLANPIPLGKLALTSLLVSITGNPTGANIRISTGTDAIRTEQITVSSAGVLVETCAINCQ